LTGPGTATIETFGQTSGTYTIDIVYVDENDGSSTLELFVDGASVGTRTLDDNTGTAAADEGNLRTWTLNNISIDSTDQIELVANPDGGERVRIDYIEFTAESTGGGGSGGGTTPPTDIIVEAESGDFTLGEGYRLPDGADFIELVDNQNPGTASTVFNGDAGSYDIVVGYLDENDGTASIAASLGGSEIGSIQLADEGGGGGAGDALRLEQTIASNRALSPGDELTLTGTPEGNEFARIDYVKFVLNELANQAPVADDDSGATAINTPLDINVLANDNDPDDDSLTVSEVDTTTDQGGTVVILENGTLRYSPANDFEGEDSFTYTVSDGELTDTATVNINVTSDPNQSPVAQDDFGTTSQDTDLVLAVLDNDNDPDEDDTLTLSSVETATVEGGTAEIQDDGITVLYRPPSGFVGTDSFTYTVADAAGATADATVTIRVNDPSTEAPSIKQTGDNLFVLEGTGATAKFSIEDPSNTPGEFEFGFYATDSIGLDPGSEGYTAAALGQATTVFSLLGDGDVQLPSLERILSLAANTNYSFFLVENGTADSFLNGGEGTVTLGSLLDANVGGPLQYQFFEETGAYQLNWDTDGDGTFELNVDLSFPADAVKPLGTAQQGNSEGELLDFRGVASVELNVHVYREAAFNNQVGFYRIENEQGAIRVGDDLLNPGDNGYVEAALNQWRNNPALQTSGGVTSNYEFTLEGGLWAPFITVDGTIEDYLDNQSGNDPDAIYFNFIGANSDGADHVKLLGDNVFGFEDRPGGGDRDFDDLIVKITAQPVV
jgi:hypothetical protein